MWKIIGVLVVVALVGSYYLAKEAEESANEGIEQKEYVKGNPEASVVLVEYSDFQCPACAQFYPIVKELVEENSENLRFEYRHFPLTTIHPYAVRAAVVAEAAGQQDKFYEMHDLLFENQSVWSNSVNPQVYFLEYAQELDLDIRLFKKHLNSSVLEDKVMNDFDEAQTKGFTGTPSFTLNGEKLEFGSFEEFRSRVLGDFAIENSDDVSSSSPNNP